MAVLQDNSNNPNKQKTIVLDAQSVDTGIELGKRAAENAGLNKWIPSILVGIMLLAQVFTLSGGSNTNVDLINERVTQELVKPYTERIVVLETTVNALQLEVVELQSENDALVSTNTIYSATIVSLQEQLENNE